MFKNKVGRPSNEVLRKRKILKGMLLKTAYLYVESQHEMDKFVVESNYKTHQRKNR